MPPTDPRIDAALAGEGPSEIDDPALRAEFAELSALADEASAAMAELCSSAPEPGEFADTFAMAMQAEAAFAELEIPSSKVFSETFALRMATADAMAELTECMPSSEDFAETFATQMLAGEAMAELREATPPSERFCIDFEDHVAASEVAELRDLARQVAAAMDELTQLAPSSAAFAEEFSESFAARATPSSVLATPAVILSGPTDFRIEAALAGDLPSRKERELQRDPILSAELDELREIQELVTKSMVELAQAASAPTRFSADWVATCRHAAAGTRPAATSVRSKTHGARTGTMAAMLIGIALLGTLGFALVPRMFEIARVNTAKGQLHALQLALIHYHHEYQAYPPSGNDSLVRYLDGNPANGGSSIVFFPFDTVGSKVTPDLSFLDPWGRAYRYETGAGATHNAGRFDLWSMGPPDRSLERKLANWIDELKLPTPPLKKGD